MTGNTKHLYLVTILAGERTFSCLNRMDLIESPSMRFWRTVITAVTFLTEALPMAVLAILLIPPCFILVLEHKHGSEVGFGCQIAIEEMLMASIACNCCVFFVVARKAEIHFWKANIRRVRESMTRVAGNFKTNVQSVRKNHFPP
jgi:hypothetical protein